MEKKISEKQIQASVVSYVRAKFKGKILIHSIANEIYIRTLYSLRDKGHEVNLNFNDLYKTGFISGLPDLFLYNAETKEPVYIELKKPGKKLSENQVLCHQHIKKHKLPVYTFDNLQKCLNFIDEFAGVKASPAPF